MSSEHAPAPPSNPPNGNELEDLTESWLNEILTSWPQLYDQAQPNPTAEPETDLESTTELMENLRSACRRAAQTDLNLRSANLTPAQRQESVRAQLWEEVLTLVPPEDDPLNEEHPTGWDPQDELEHERELEQDQETERRQLEEEYRRTRP